jgi:hypothetical protein
MRNKKEVEYEVGYGKPPQRKQFRKGKSGNPSGRAKGPRNVTRLLVQALSEPVIINENGQRRQITKGEAMLKQLVNKGAAGDARSIQLLLAEIRSRMDADPAENGGPDDTQEQMLMLERLSVEERIELRRLIAKAEGTSNAQGDESVPPRDPVDSRQAVEPPTRDSEGTDEGRLLTISESTDQDAE